eukprot:UN25668
MAAKGDMLTRDIPIILHDGTILRKRDIKTNQKGFQKSLLMSMGMIIGIPGTEQIHTVVS